MLDVADRAAPASTRLLDPVLSVAHGRSASRPTRGGLRARARRRWTCRRATSCSSPATAGTPSAPPGTATPRCGSTARSCRSRRWTRSPRAPAAACATCSPSSHLQPSSDHHHDRPHHRPRPASRHRPVPLHRAARCCPAPASTPAAFWQGFDAIVHDLAPKNAALLAERDRLQARTRRLAPRATRARSATCAAYRAFLREDRLPGAGAQRVHGDHGERRRRTGAAGRPAAGGADHQRALRAERGQRALGLAVRRAVRHRRAPRRRRRREGHAATTRCAAPR